MYQEKKTMYRYWFINCNKHTMLMQDNNKLGVGREVCGNSLSYAQFFCEPKTVLKKKIFFNEFTHSHQSDNL